MNRLAGVVGLAMLCAPLGAARANLVSTDGGATITDTVTGITWLQNFDLAASERFGVVRCVAGGPSDCVNANGTMDLRAAQAWISNLNNDNNGAGYLGHTNWELPPTSAAPLNSGCSATGPNPNNNPFAFGCTNSALASIYHTLGATLGITAPARLGPATAINDGPFFNFQPGLYWSGSRETSNTNLTNGYRVFSFATGWQGSEVGVDRPQAVGGNYDYVLPMTKGRLPGQPPISGTALVYDPVTQTVYDPVNDVTWIANANLAASTSFGMPTCNGVGGTTPCIGPNGSMNWTAATAFVTQYMDQSGPNGYLGVSTWQLPQIPTIDTACSKMQLNNLMMPFWYGFGCSGSTSASDPGQYSPMGYLFYNQLTDPSGNRLTQGESVGGTLKNTVGPFSNLEPYYYWQCTASNPIDALTSTCPPGSPPPAPGFGWSYSFDDGFQSTDVNINQFYVEAEYIEEPGTAALLMSALAIIAMIKAADVSGSALRSWDRSAKEASFRQTGR